MNFCQTLDFLPKLITSVYICLVKITSSIFYALKSCLSCPYRKYLLKEQLKIEEALKDEILWNMCQTLEEESSNFISHRRDFNHKEINEYLLFLEHCFMLQSLLSVLLPLVLVCTPGPQDAEQAAHVDQRGWGHGWVLHPLSSVWPSLLILDCRPPPHDAEQGDHGDQRGCATGWPDAVVPNLSVVIQSRI